MNDFYCITPFRLVRSIGAAGVGNPAIYLLICEAAVSGAVQSDLLDEIGVQLGAPVRTETASELLANGLPLSRDGFIRLVYIDQWLPNFVDSLDRHSVLLVQDGGQLLLLAEKQIADRFLRRAPNLRNRLTDIFQIGPDDLSGGNAA